MARAALLALLVLVACAPRLVPPGDPIRPPALTENAVAMADGARLPLRRWDPPGSPTAVVLALHGFNDYSMFFAAPAGYLAQRGILSYAYDQRGFGGAPHRGRWAGVAAYADDLSAVVSLLRDRHQGLPLYLLGESMGGAVAVAALTSADPPRTDGVILAAPAVWARSTWPAYQRLALWIGAHVVPWLPVSGRGLNIRPSDNIEMLHALGRDPLVIKDTRIDTIWGLANLMDRALSSAPKFRDPALILYGSRDEIVPGEPFARFARGLTDPVVDRQVVALYDGSYHMLLRDLEAERVWRDIAAWIAASDEPLPSAADLRARLRLPR